MKLSHILKAGALALSVVVVPTVSAQALPEAVEIEPGGALHVPGEVLIKFKPDVTDAQLSGVFKKGKLRLLKQIRTRAMKDRGEAGITQTATTLPVAEAVKALAGAPGIEIVQPNWVYQTQSYGLTDPFYNDGTLWGMSSAPASAGGIGADQAWTRGFTGSSDVVVGVIDSGIEYHHADLLGNMWINEAEHFGQPGVDDDDVITDAISYPDDVHGWNSRLDNGNIYDGSDPLIDDHGTHVAGVIGAVGGNSTGVSGVNWDVTMISGKFIGPTGGATANAIQALDYMTYLKETKGLNIVAVNNSWGGGKHDPVLLDSITRAANAQILFVAASGGVRTMPGYNVDTNLFYPASYDTTAGAGYDSVISVTAIDKAGALPSWANYGPTTVDLAAPGVGIVSTVPYQDYWSMTGSSMAAPHVTGAIALYAATHAKYLAAHPAPAKAIRDALLSSTTSDPSLEGKTVTGGKLDLMKFLYTGSAPEAPAAAPVAPRAPAKGPVAMPLNSAEAKLAWTHTTKDESGFKIQRSVNGGAWSDLVIVGPNETQYVDKGLAVNVNYAYRIAAFNPAGASVPLEGKVRLVAPSVRK
jgi:subtilisin family serine protease